jgi:hypothetical protein
VVYVFDSSESHHCIKKGTCSHSDVFDESSKQDKLRFHPPAVAKHCAKVFAAAKLAPVGEIGLVGTLGSDGLSYVTSSFGPRLGEALRFAEPLGWNRGLGAHPKVLLEVFSGCAHLCSSFEKLGSIIFAFDNVANKADDSLDDDYFLHLLRGIYEFRFGAVHLGILCRTWSVARFPHLRNYMYLVNGLPDLSSSERSLV